MFIILVKRLLGHTVDSKLDKFHAILKPDIRQLAMNQLFNRNSRITLIHVIGLLTFHQIRYDSQELNEILLYFINTVSTHLFL